MPALQTTRDEAAQATAEALSAIQACYTASKTKKDNIAKGGQKSVENAVSIHTACKEAEKALYDQSLSSADPYCDKC